MIYSMTAYAQQHGQGTWGTLRWEVRSVNHRYLEVGFKLPESLRSLEPRLRELTKRYLHRGKVECSLYYQLEKQAQAWQLNEGLIDEVIAASKKIEQKLSNPEPMSALDILSWPDVIRKNDSLAELLGDTAVDTFEKALSGLAENRQREGQALGSMVGLRIEKMGEELAKIHGHQAHIIQQLKEKMMAKLKDLSAPMDSARLEQEMVYWAQKCDVAEELDRLHVHMDEVMRVLKEGGVVGRRLDFLMQELNRETNTLASKAIDSLTSSVTVELKVLIEQMREQVQNIE